MYRLQQECKYEIHELLINKMRHKVETDRQKDSKHCMSPFNWVYNEIFSVNIYEKKKYFLLFNIGFSLA